MKLNYPYKIVGSIPDELINESLSLIKTEFWEIDKMRNKMGSLTQTKSIVLRHFNDYKSVNSENWKNEIYNKQLYPIFENLINKILYVLRKEYHFRDYIAFFARLKPKGIVGLHVDSGPFLETCHRIHIPIKTNENVFYIIEDQKYNWTKGNIYEFDNTRIHGVVNESDEERIHLLFNLYPD